MSDSSTTAETLSFHHNLLDKQLMIENVPVCGGRRFKRPFSKKDFPLLGDDGEEEDPMKCIFLSSLARKEYSGGKSTSVLKMRDLLRDPITGRWRWPVNGADQVYPGIYLGDAYTAMCIKVLKELNITAVLNASQGTMSDWNYVNTKASYYVNSNIAFFGIPAVDLKHYPINQHFQERADFIHKVIQNRGVILVHCVAGISRSASMVLAYLIIKKKMTLEEAINTVKKKRSIAPNEGFLEQLIELNDTIHHLKK
uniref:protein-serine/threonine phosphatase n=1 Tax=Lepeophtheirus salmonis TaxID=72036 RepID=C1BT00_LEPSM|nr:Dual specificity protein phosphatase 3 [Lepeophtheirus salmonis]